MRLSEPLQDEPADAHLRFANPDVFDPKAFFRVELGVVGPQPITAQRNCADAAPFAIANLEYGVEQFAAAGGLPSRRTPRTY